MSRLETLPRSEVTVDAEDRLGPWEWWRCAVGQGGINDRPLPDRVTDGLAKLRPRLVRVFLQEFFFVYPGGGRFDWSCLDDYLDSFAVSGANVVAAITLKPEALFPRIDQTVWEPNDWRAWQTLIYELVRRYSVKRPIVTHWEIGNETDIGESGGCPYLITDPAAYATYYEKTVEPIRRAFPAARVGGPAVAGVSNEPLPGLIEHCRRTGTPLDFVSWHRYDDSTEDHVAGIERVQAALQDFPGPRPETFVTEWSNSFPAVSVQETTGEPRHAANVAVTLLAMHDAGLDWSFYYHLWDQVFDPAPFRQFFSDAGVRGMQTHWNEVPHRFGLFGVGGEVRPTYFAYQMLGRLGDERVRAQTDSPDLHVAAARDGANVSALLINFRPEASEDRVVTLRFHHLEAGPRRLTVYRVDSERRWSDETLKMRPVERRETYVEPDFRCQVYCPADSVTLVTLGPVEEKSP